VATLFAASRSGSIPSWLRRAGSGSLLAVATVAQAPDPILARLSAETTNVLVVRDVLPVLEGVLASPAVVQFLDGTAELQRETLGTSFDVRTLQRQLRTIAPFVPTEVVVAAPTRTLDRLTHAAPLFASVTVLQMLARAGVKDGELVDKARATANAALRQFDGLPMQAWVTVRDERTAEQWFDTVVEALEAGAAAAFTVVVGDGRLELRGEPFGERSPWRAAMQAVGIDSTSAPAWSVEVVFEQRGPTISMQVGKLAPGPCPPAALGEAWAEAPGALAFTRTEVSDAAAELIDAWLHIAALGDVELADGDAMLMVRLVDFLGRVDAIAADQTVVLVVDRGIEWTHDTHLSVVAIEDYEPVPPELKRLAAAAAGPFLASSDALDVLLLSALETLAEGEAEVSDAAAPVVDYLESEDASRFQAGTMLLARAAEFRAGEQWKHGPMPFAAAALVARPKEAGDGAAFMTELSTRLAIALEIEGALWALREFELPAKAHGLRLDALAPDLAGHGLEHAFVPHWIESDGWLVVATDPKLTRDVLTALRTAGREPAGPRVLQQFELRGASLVDTFAAMAKWMPHVAEFGGEAPADGVAFFTACRALAEQIDFVQQVTTYSDHVLRERQVVRLRPTK